MTSREILFGVLLLVFAALCVGGIIAFLVSQSKRQSASKLKDVNMQESNVQPVQVKPQAVQQSDSQLLQQVAKDVSFLKTIVILALIGNGLLILMAICNALAATAGIRL